jgi:cytochrome c-type biogenesis protein CcmH
MLWFVFALLTALCLACVVWPVWRAAALRPRDASDLAFYRAQLAEIERDLARGLIDEPGAITARAEAARRLLAASETTPVAAPPTAAAWRRNLVLAASVLLMPGLALGLYSQLGSPGLRDLPLEGRLNTPPDQQDLAAAVARVEAHLASHPDDGRGYEILGPVYMHTERYDDAVQAYASALRLLGETAQRRTAYGEALVYAADGIVTAEARTAFEAAKRLDANFVMADFYLALAAEQDGDFGRAQSMLAALIAKAPPDAPYLDAVRQRQADLQSKMAAMVPQGVNKEAAGAIAGLSGEAQQAAIHGMVDRLAARLETEGGDIDGWLKLIRAYMVLKEPERARQALGTARERLTRDAVALQRLDALAHELGLGG